MIEGFFDSCPGICLVASLDGVITRANQEATRALGEPGAEGRSLLDLVHPEDRGYFGALWARLSEDGEASRAVSRLRGADGQYQAFSWSARRVKDGPAIHAVLLPAAPEGPEAAPRPEDPAQILRRILDQTDIVVSVVYPDGNCTVHDGKTLETTGIGRHSLVGKNLLAAYASEPFVTDNVKAALRGEDRHYVVEAHGFLWETWFSAVKDTHGEVIASIGVTLDKSESKRAMEELQARIDIIERQQEVIRNLETPIIELWERVVTLPMVGVVDSARAARVMDDLLASVSRLGAKFALLDLTGVDTVDTATAAHLLALISALRLLGCDGIITGIRPTVAQTVVSLGLDLDRLTTCSNLREGLKLCIRRLHAQTTADTAVGALV